VPVNHLHELVLRAARLRRRFGRHSDACDRTEELPAWLKVPCAIIGTSIVPLRRVPRARFKSTTDAVMLGEEVYTLREAGSGTYEEFRRSWSRVNRAHIQKEVMGDKDLVGEAAAFMEDVRSVLDLYEPEKKGRYERFYSDKLHELQHSRGFWTLVRGPVRSRTGDGTLFVGLPLSGATRRKILASSPFPAKTAKGFWTPGGEPFGGGICMGPSPQYKHLLTNDFTDAEAAVEWLDAGTILASGRSVFHQAWREGGSVLELDVPVLVSRWRRRRRWGY
jgi:hypothetical protein